MNEHTLDDLTQLQGAPVYSSEGEKIGAVEEIYYDDETSTPEWLGIGTGFLRLTRVVVPLQTATVADDAITVPFTKDQVKGSPDIGEEQISQETEAELAAYYGVSYSERRSDTGLPEGTPTTGTAGDERSLTRSEEELAIGKRSTEAGTVRLRKWVSTEPVSEEVELRTERARVHREPIEAEAVGDAAIGEQEVEVALRTEEAVIDKRTVAKERISVSKEVETDTQTVEDELRKEHVEVEGDDVQLKP